MKVLKFGGTSVGSVENMRAVMQLITDGNQKTVVLSAMAGTTNSLVEIANYLQKKNKDAARQVISQLEQKYYKVVNDLYTTPAKQEKGKAIVFDIFGTIKSFTAGDFSEVAENTIVAQGELLSTALFTELMLENGYKALYLPALNFMKIDKDKAADSHFIQENITKILNESEPADYYITQGFICRNSEGNIDNLQRGGSDYTATLIGAAINSEEVEIWTDIDGFHNNDPRFVENTQKIDQLSFDEAAELAYSSGQASKHTGSVKKHNESKRFRNSDCVRIRNKRDQSCCRKRWNYRYQNPFIPDVKCIRLFEEYLRDLRIFQNSN